MVRWTRPTCAQSANHGRAEPSPEGKRFGDVIRRMRKERGLTQERLAERADIATDYLGFIERG